MNIRIANINDMAAGIAAIKENLKEFPELASKHNILTDKYYETLFTHCLNKGVIIIAEENNNIIGVIISTINSNILTSTNELITLVTWVHKDKRNGSCFYRLHKLYEEKYNKLLNTKQIEKVLIFKLPSKTNINYEKLGYKLTQSTYEKENN